MNTQEFIERYSGFVNFDEMSDADIASAVRSGGIRNRLSRVSMGAGPSPAPSGVAPARNSQQNFPTNSAYSLQLNVKRDTINAGAASQLPFIFGYPQGVSSNYKIVNQANPARGLSAGYVLEGVDVGDRAGGVSDDAESIRFRYGNGTLDDTITLSCADGIALTEFINRIDGTSSFTMKGYEIDCSGLTEAQAAQVFSLKPVAFQKTIEGRFQIIPMKSQTVNAYQQRANIVSTAFDSPLVMNAQTGISWLVAPIAGLEYSIRMFFAETYNF